MLKELATQVPWGFDCKRCTSFWTYEKLRFKWLFDMFCNRLLLFPFWAPKFFLSSNLCNDHHALLLCWYKDNEVLPAFQRLGADCSNWAISHQKFFSQAGWKLAFRQSGIGGHFGRCETILIFFKTFPIYVSLIWTRMQGNSFLGLGESPGSVSTGNAKLWFSDHESQESSRMSNILRTEISTIKIL